MNVQPARPPWALSQAVSAATAGLAVFLLGLTWLANALGLEQLYRALWGVWPWPVVMFLVGICLLLASRSNVGLALYSILLGVWVWALHESWVHTDVPPLDVWFALLVVCAGSGSIWQAFSGPPNRWWAPYVISFPVLSRDDIRPNLPFEGAQLGALLGKCRLDLSRATMVGDTANIDVSLLMGSAEIIVPPDWDVLLQVTRFLGSCTDGRRVNPAPTRRVMVHARAIISRVTVRN